jgi:OOP family OmpA-OmpF porin
MKPYTLSAEDRRKRRRIWFCGTAALLLLAAACVGWVALRIPQDIAARTTAALQTAGLDPRAAVSVDGRTVTLTGEVPDAFTRARTRAIAASIRGVRHVVDRLTVAPLRTGPLQAADAAPPAPPQKAPPALRSPLPETARQARGAAPAPAVPVSAPEPPPAAAGIPSPPEPEAQPKAAAQPPPQEPPPPLPDPPPRTQPAPAPAAAAAAAEPTRLQLPLLHFQFDSTRLTPDSEPRLREIVAALQKHPGLRIELAGHADATGPGPYNRQLSLRRAAAVADRLAAAGIDRARLQVRGYGESRPLMDNHSRRGRAMNRRVEFAAIG